MHSHSHTAAPDPQDKQLLRAYRVSIALNLGFVILEVLIGVLHHSMGLVSDAGHKLIDVFSLLIALLGFRFARRSGGADAFRRVSAGIALVNAAILLVAVGIIIYESLLKFAHPEPVDGAAISWTAGVGILVSGLSAWLLMKHRGDINTWAAFLHMATDSLLSLGVVLSGIAISLTGQHAIDPAVSLMIAAVILFNTVRVTVQAIRTLLDQ